MKRFSYNIERRVFHFKQPAGTSRGVYTERCSWLIRLASVDKPGVVGVGECAPLPDLSCDAIPGYDAKLASLLDDFADRGEVCHSLWQDYPSMLFGIETALLHLNSGSLAFFNTAFSRGEEGIPINGLVWMGTFEEMQKRIEEKLEQGFTCVKLKVGAIGFEQELALVKSIRSRFSVDCLQLRLDANGGFGVDDVMEKLETLARYGIHSIEQPIRQGQWEAMSYICRNTPIPIGFDEELIGCNDTDSRKRLVKTLKPQYLVLKPSLHGGMGGVGEWVRLGQESGIQSWITSALESNVGLNAIAQLAACLYGPNVKMAQGLGTGQLFSDNIPMPIHIKGSRLWFTPSL